MRYGRAIVTCTLLLGVACRPPERLQSGNASGGVPGDGAGSGGAAGAKTTAGGATGGSGGSATGMPDAAIASGGVSGGNGGRAGGSVAPDAGTAGDATGATETGGARDVAIAPDLGAGAGLGVDAGATDARPGDAGQGCTAEPALDLTLCGAQHFFFCGLPTQIPSGCVIRGSGTPVPICCP